MTAEVVSQGRCRKKHLFATWHSRAVHPATYACLVLFDIHHQQYFFSGLNFGICNPYRIVLCACMMEMECDVVRCNVMYCHIMSCNVPSCTVLYCTVLYGSVWQCVVLYGTACVLLLISYCIHVAVRHVASCCVMLCSYMVCCVIWCYVVLPSVFLI